MINESALSVRSGDVVTDERGRLSPEFTRKWNALVRAVVSIGRPTGIGVRRRELPDQTIVSFDSKASIREESAFRVSIFPGQGDGESLVTVGFGVLDGIEPVIGERRITELDSAGEPPSLKIHSADFGADDRCRLYLKITTNTGYAPTRVEVVSAAGTPDREPYIAFKLLAVLLRRDGGVRAIQAAKRNLGFEATERRADGRFRPIFWAAD